MLSIKWGVLFGVFGVLAGLAAYYGYFKSSPHFEQAPRLIGAKLLDMQVTSPAIYLAFAVFLSVPHSLLEEYYWRWFAFGELRRVCDTNLALLVTSLAFMSHHVIVIHQFIQGPWWLTAFLSSCVALGGCVWAWLYHRYGSLYGAWISHLLIDCGIMFIGYDLVSWG
jgi:membrane protease YdiL (CAAX protease family)